jgi:hypothetical protein
MAFAHEAILPGETFTTHVRARSCTMGAAARPDPVYAVENRSG